MDNRRSCLVSSCSCWPLACLVITFCYRNHRSKEAEDLIQQWRRTQKVEVSQIQRLGQKIDSQLPKLYYEDNDVYRMCIQVIKSMTGYPRILKTDAINMETVLTIASDHKDQSIKSVLMSVISLIDPTLTEERDKRSAESMLQLLSNDDKYKKLREAIQQHAKLFNEPRKYRVSLFFLA